MFVQSTCATGIGHRGPRRFVVERASNGTGRTRTAHVARRTVYVDLTVHAFSAPCASINALARGGGMTKDNRSGVDADVPARRSPPPSSARATSMEAPATFVGDRVMQVGIEADANCCPGSSRRRQRLAPNGRSLGTRHACRTRVARHDSPRHLVPHERHSPAVRGVAATLPRTPRLEVAGFISAKPISFPAPVDKVAKS